MLCRNCNSKNTRVTCTTHILRGTKRYCRCLDCHMTYRTVETYEQPKRGSALGQPRHPNQVKQGAEVGTAVLTEENVKELRKLAEQRVTYAALSERFGIHKDTVYRIVKRKLWSHVS